MQCHIIIIVITQIFLRTTNVCVCIGQKHYVYWDPNKYSEPNKKNNNQNYIGINCDWNV